MDWTSVPLIFMYICIAIVIGVVIGKPRKKGDPPDKFVTVSQLIEAINRIRVIAKRVDQRLDTMEKLGKEHQEILKPQNAFYALRDYMDGFHNKEQKSENALTQLGDKFDKMLLRLSEHDRKMDLMLSHNGLEFKYQIENPAFEIVAIPEPEEEKS